MELKLSTLILLLLIAVVVALVTRRTRRPYTVALVIWGLILGLLQVFEMIPLSRELILTVFLPPLLFEGALHIRAKILRRRAGMIFGLALGGTLVTALAVGAAAHFLLGFDWLAGLLLGVIVAPTDPVSVLATFRAARVDRDLSTIVEGESLFNDGIAVVLYIIVLEASGGVALSPLHSVGEFLLVVGGGSALGLVVGILANALLQHANDHLIEITSTLVVAYGVYLLAEYLHLSGVVAVAIAALVIGNRGLRSSSPASRAEVTIFWDVVAFLVNSIVFLLIGFELQPARLVDDILSAGLVVAALMAVRALLVYGLGALLHRWRPLPWSWRHVIFWGGLRGSVPIALALGLPVGLAGRDQIVGIVFGVVLISLLGQGLTIPALIRRLGLTQTTRGLDAHPRNPTKVDDAQCRIGHT